METEKKTRGQTVLEVSELSKSFGSLEVLTNLSMRVEAGQVYGFLGRNGAGKSTTIQILVGILKVGRGQVKIFGENMESANTALRQRIGYVAQHQNFYPWMTPVSLGDFVKGFYPNWDARRYDELLDKLELPRNGKVGVFSGGMKAKQALALALAHSPPLLILDEPTAGLDPVARREFFRSVRQQAVERGATVLFSSHLIDEVEKVADKVGIIARGKMIFEGPLKVLSQQVRKLRFEGELQELPDSVQVLSQESKSLVVWGTDLQELSRLVETGSFAQGESLSLEDIFVELVTSKVP